MKTPEEIVEMRARLEDNIREVGWDAALDAASAALAWVLGDTLLDADRALRELTERPEADRRHDWIARGGNPDDWPVDIPEGT